MKLVLMKKTFALVGTYESNEDKSCWGYGRQTKGIMDDTK